MRHAILGALCLVACGDTSPQAVADAGDAAVVCTGGETYASIMTQFTFARQRPMGVSAGFDLDGRVTPAGDTMSCGRPDFTDPDGVAGIDNQFAEVIAVIDQLTTNAVDPLVQAAINNGQILMGVVLEHVDDTQNDPCVELVLQSVQGQATVGSDGFLDRGQTFDAIPGNAPSRTHASIRNGVVEAGPFELALPVTVLDARFTLNLHNAHVRLTLGKDRAMTGLIGGGISVEEMSATVGTLTIPSGQMSAFRGIIRNVADLNRVGTRCEQFSAAMTFQARGAFVNF